MVHIQFNQEEINAVMTVIDAALKAGGVNVIRPASNVMAKFELAIAAHNAAVQAAQSAAALNEAPAAGQG